MADTTHATTEGANNRDRAAAGAREGRAAVERGTRETKQLLREGAETAKEQIGAAAGLARDTAEQSQDLTRAGLRAAAEVHGQLADLGHDQGRRGIHAAARVADIYRDTAETTAGDVQALILAFSHIGQGVQQMQHAWLDLLERSLDQATRRPQDLLRCNSPVEFAEAQRDLYRDSVAYLVDATSTMLDVMGRTAHDASRSLGARG